MSNNPGFAPFTLVSINPDGSFTTKLEEEVCALAAAAPFGPLDHTEEETIYALLPEEPRRYEVREGDGYLRRDRSLAPTYEIWAVEGGAEWCVDTGIRRLRTARLVAKNWQRGYMEALSE